MILSRIRYRVAQFFQTLRDTLRPVDASKDLPYVRARLSPQLQALFRRLPRVEQHHGIAVARTLEAQGHDDPDLLTAALLHDVGKIKHPPRLWERVLVVLGEHYVPQLARRWSEGSPRGLRRGFVVRRRHPQWGAELVADAGGAARVVSLIRRHHAPPGDDAALAALQAVDNDA
jgi:putative nucleotidyltransferase with HDIG domain